MAELMLKLKDRVISQIAITKVETMIGRDPGNDLVIDNAGVSRAHARVRYEGGSFVVSDLDSSNGIFVNGKATRMQALHGGDEVQIGKFTVVFHERGGVQVDRLLPPPVVPSADGARRQSVHQTTHLTQDEIQKLLKATGKPPLDAPPPTPAPVAPARVQNTTVIGPPSNTWKVLAIVLGIGCVALLATTLYLLLG